MISVLLCVASAAAVAAPDAKKLPVTAASDDARQLYLKARDLAEKLRATDAHAVYEQALAKDPSCALAHLGYAGTSGSARAFRESLDKALALADKVSPGEKLVILAADAGAKGDLVHQREYLDKVVKLYPGDEHVLIQLANFQFANQDYAAAIATFEKTIKIAPRFTQPYNQLGYAYRFTGKPAEAAKAFEKYIELLPGDPNPYDSYGELLMEQGRFDDSIKSYEKALAIDPNFMASYIGIGNDQILLGKGADARATFARMAKQARNDGERRQAIFWTAQSYNHEGAWDKALAEVDKLAAIATAAKDLATLANDHAMAAAILTEAGRYDAAAARLRQEVEIMDKAPVPDAVKAQTHRNVLAGEIRIALAKSDLAAAKPKLAEYGKLVAAANNPLETRQHHELLGLLAIASKQWKLAGAELAQANQRDPRVLYYQAIAHQGAGDAGQARKLATKAADFNGLAPNYGYVRGKARTLAKS